MFQDNGFKMRSIKFLFLILFFCLIQNSFANSTTKNNKATAQLVSSCAISAQNMSFGLYDPSQDSFSTGQINYRCTKGTKVTVYLNEPVGGTLCSNKYCFPGANGMVGGRVMSGSSDSLIYNLFSSANYNATTLLQGTNYGTGNSGVFTTDGTNQTMSIYGALSNGQWVKPGLYLDNVTVLFSY